MRREIRVVEHGFYETIKVDDKGLPTFGKPVRESVIPPDLKEFEIYIRFAGDPGLYNLTMTVQGEGKKRDISMDYGSQQVAVPIGGDAHFTAPFAGRGMPEGSYEFCIRRDGELLYKFDFAMSDSGPPPSN